MLLTKVSGGTSRHLLLRIAMHALAPQCTARGCHVISLRGSSQAPSVRFACTLNRTCLSLHTTNHFTRLANSRPLQSIVTHCVAKSSVHRLSSSLHSLPIPGYQPHSPRCQRFGKIEPRKGRTIRTSRRIGQ